MKISTMAGWCLIVLGVVNVLHEISLRASGRHEPGLAYAIVTALFFTAGAVFLCLRKIRKS